MLTDRQRYLLRVVWEMGPAANAEIAREAGLKSEACYAELYRLRCGGYIAMDCYDVTEAGVRVVLSENSQPQRRLW